MSLTAAGALSLLLPAVAAASTGHGGGGGGLFAAFPVGSIFSDILGSIGGFGKDVIKTIFGSILTLFFGGSWKVLMHPYEIVEWLIGLPGTGNTTAFVPFGNNGAGPFAALCKDTQAIGLGLLPLAQPTTRCTWSAAASSPSRATTCTTSARCSPPPS